MENFQDKRDAPPWWLEGGEEICPFCGQPYVYEMEHRCSLCDVPLCPWCYEEESPDILCPECAACDEGGI